MAVCPGRLPRGVCLCWRGAVPYNGAHKWRPPEGITRIDGTTTIVGLIGDGIRGSLSPRFQNAAFAALGLNWCYVAFQVSRDRLEGALRGLLALGVAGANVTVPHKEAILAYMDDVTDEARRVGAVNTIQVDGDRMVGHNTDTTGMLDALTRDGGLVVQGQRAAVVGAGGAARAAVFALAGAGAHAVTIINRNWDRAAALADAARRAFRCAVDAVPLDGTAASSALRGATLLVQATTVGGGAQRGVSPIPRPALHAGLFVMDMVYDPEETMLLREARAAGCRTLGGLPMLVYQGARAFEIWTGRAAPLRVMRDAVGLPDEPASTA